MAMLSVQAFVSGRVQRVWYRESTKRQALARGVTGWAKNLPDGRVEVLLCGEQDAVNQVLAWLHEGPPNAQVKGVETQVLEWQTVSGFTTS